MNSCSPLFPKIVKFLQEHECRLHEHFQFLLNHLEVGNIPFSLVLQFCILDCLYNCVTYNLTDGIRVYVLALTCLVDHLMYGSWILVSPNFLKFNFLSSGGDYYGTHKWHQYFTQGFPVMLFTFLPFAIVGIVLSQQWKPSGLIAWVLGLYSVLGHKEFR